MPVSDEIEQTLWESAEELRGQVEASEYKHIVLGLLFLRDASLKFKRQKQEFEDDDSLPTQNKKALKKYLSSNQAFYVPEEARWDNIQKEDNLPNALDEAMEAIMQENDRLKARLPKRFQQSGIEHNSLQKLMQDFEKIDFEEDEDTDEDFVGRIYEYFIKQFGVSSAQQDDGAFYTPEDVVELLVKSLKPLNGRIFDPCAGTGGMFVQSYKYANKLEGGDSNDLIFYGQESNSSTINLAEMNMFLHNLGDQTTIMEGDSLINDKMPELGNIDGSLEANKVITNPPFNIGYSPEKIDPEDPRFKYGLPNSGNANYAFIQHMLYHTKEGGMVGTVMSNGALANNSNKDIRKGIVDDDLVDIIITLPKKLFSTTSIPVSIFIFSKGKGSHNEDHRDRSNETLFIDASDLFTQKSRAENRLEDSHIKKIAGAIQRYRGDGSEEYSEDEYNISNFCAVATSDEIADTDYSLNPGRYISIDDDSDTVPLNVEIPKLQGKLENKFEEGRELEEEIINGLNSLEGDD